MTPHESKGPLVSIIMPCHNSERFLREILESVYQQTYPHWELIAVDDASTDSTLRVLKAAAEKDQRVVVIQRNSCGGKPAISNNTVLSHARGEFILFLDHDDIILKGTIETLLKILQENPTYVASFHDLQYIDDAGEAGSNYFTTFKTDASDYLTHQSRSAYLCNENCISSPPDIPHCKRKPASSPETDSARILISSSIQNIFLR